MPAADQNQRTEPSMRSTGPLRAGAADVLVLCADPFQMFGYAVLRPTRARRTSVSPALRDQPSRICRRRASSLSRVAPQFLSASGQPLR